MGMQFHHRAHGTCAEEMRVWLLWIWGKEEGVSGFLGLGPLALTSENSFWHPDPPVLGSPSSRCSKMGDLGANITECHHLPSAGTKSSPLPPMLANREFFSPFGSLLSCQLPSEERHKQRWRLWYCCLLGWRMGRISFPQSL